MARADFHNEPFDDGTQNKLDLFERFAGEWIPVFVAKPTPSVSEIHIFDFFAGPGRDTDGQPGSPVRLLGQLAKYTGQPGWGRVAVHAHFFDQKAAKVDTLQRLIETEGLAPQGCTVNVKRLEFKEALESARAILRRSDAAKLVLIDQTGVDAVPDDLFLEMIAWPKCDFLFFVSSSTFHRFQGHPAIKQMVKRADDYHHAHRAAFEHYRSLIPPNRPYFLGQFSFKKGANIYGLIFGSGHPLGLDKFLRTAWGKDAFNGEADFDIGREGLTKDQSSLFERTPTKIAAFEEDLERKILSGEVVDEMAVLQVCFSHGVRGPHANPVLSRLKGTEITLEFRTPDVKNWSRPRRIRLLGRSRK